jgi:hypothetical protein
MTKDPKAMELRDGRSAKALEKEKAHIRQALPDILAREASELASKQRDNRAAALNDIRRRVTHGQLARFEWAFFECLFEWLAQRDHHEAAQLVRVFIDERLAPELR